MLKITFENVCWLGKCLRRVGDPNSLNVFDALHQLQSPDMLDSKYKLIARRLIRRGFDSLLDYKGNKQKLKRKSGIKFVRKLHWKINLLKPIQLIKLMKRSYIITKVINNKPNYYRSFNKNNINILLDEIFLNNNQILLILVLVLTKQKSITNDLNTFLLKKLPCNLAIDFIIKQYRYYLTKKIRWGCYCKGNNIPENSKYLLELTNKYEQSLHNYNIIKQYLPWLYKEAENRNLVITYWANKLVIELRKCNKYQISAYKTCNLLRNICNLMMLNKKFYENVKAVKCNKPLMSKIVTNRTQDTNPTITCFKTTYRRHTMFSIESRNNWYFNCKNQNILVY
jgi:hypothetical protein